MKRHWGMAAFLGGLLLFSPAFAWAQGNSEGHGHGKGHHKGEDQDEDRDGHGHHTRIYFSDHDRTVIYGYFHERGPEGLPPGLAKRDRLPPGLEKQLRERGTLPPGLEKKIRPCPEELDRQLPPLPPDYRRAVVGGTLVILNNRTHVVVSVLHDIVPY